MKQEHIDLITQGVEIWNQWRDKPPDIKPDLSGADARGWFTHCGYPTPIQAEPPS